MVDGRHIFRDLVKRHTELVDPSDSAARENAYAHARAEADDFLVSQIAPRDPDLATMLMAQFEEIVKDDRRAWALSEPDEDEPDPASSGRGGVLLGVVCGVALSALIAGAVWTAGYWPGSSPLTEGEKRLLEDHRAKLPTLVDARGFLNRAADEVRRMIAEGAPALAQADSNFVPIINLMPDPAKEKPKSLSPYGVLVRSSGSDYKILIAGLCSSATAEAPELVDPRRAIACTHIGVWTPGAENW